MADLKAYYSSGSLKTDVFEMVSKSVGGIKTTMEMANFNRNLFPPISYKAITEGEKEYRAIFIQNNTDLLITNLKVKIPFPEIAPVLDPILLAPPPPVGQEYIVPAGATGAWQFKDGKIAKFVSTGIWEFRFNYFGKISVAGCAPYILPIGNANFLATVTIENGFQHPFGIEFLPLLTNLEQVLLTDSLPAGESIVLWIERNVEKYKFIDDTDFKLGEGALKISEIVPLTFDYDIESVVPSFNFSIPSNSQNIPLL